MRRRPTISSFFFNDTATTEIYTLSLHDALPICWRRAGAKGSGVRRSSSPARAESRRNGSSRGGCSVAGLETVGSALLALGLVAVAVGLSLYARLDLYKHIGIALVRPFVQPAGVGDALACSFRLERLPA